MLIKQLALICALTIAYTSSQSTANNRVVCFYDSAGFEREGLGKVSISDLEPAAPFCTHLVYGYAGINPETNKLISLKEATDLDTGKGHFRLITALRSKNPKLKVILGVGGGADPNKEAYLTLLESTAGRVSFINSAYTIIKSYGFDGLDLSWEFPLNKPKKVRTTIGSFWHKLKKTVGATGSPVDENWASHRDQFTSLIRELKAAFNHDKYELSLTVLPNVNSTVYMDVPSIIHNLDYVTIGAYDFYTPERNPKEADYPSSLYQKDDNVDGNINNQVLYWTTNKAPASKIVVGIPTFGRSWKMTANSGTTGVPPIPETEGAAPQGPQSQKDGIFSYPEMCAKLPNPSNRNLKGEDAPLTKVIDTNKRFGTYAYRLPDGDGNFGMWVGYEDIDTADNKAGYVLAKGHGGVAIFDLSLDDFRGTCTGVKFPIVNAVKRRLM